MNVKEQIAAGTGYTNGKPHALTMTERYCRLMDRARMAERQERRSATSGWAREAEQCRELAAAFRGPAFREIYATGDRVAARAFAWETGLLTFQALPVFVFAEVDDRAEVSLNGIQWSEGFPPGTIFSFADGQSIKAHAQLISDSGDPGPLPDPQPQPKLEP